MHELHAEVRKAPAVDAAKRHNTTGASSSLAAPAQPAAQSAALTTPISAPTRRPFAIIDEVSAASPAEEAGLQIGDQLVSFADVTAQTGDTLPTVGATLQVQSVLQSYWQNGSVPWSLAHYTSISTQRFQACIQF